MLRSRFIDEVIVARSKPKDAAAFHTPSNGLHISGAQHKMTLSYDLARRRCRLHARVQAERRPPYFWLSVGFALRILRNPA
jgi:hypothetical protein